MDGAWSCTKDRMQIGLNRALQALTSGSTQVGQAREEAKGAARAQLGGAGQASLIIGAQLWLRELRAHLLLLGLELPRVLSG